MREHKLHFAYSRQHFASKMSRNYSAHFQKKIANLHLYFCLKIKYCNKLNYFPVSQAALKPHSQLESLSCTVPHKHSRVTHMLLECLTCMLVPKQNKNNFLEYGSQGASHF